MPAKKKLTLEGHLNGVAVPVSALRSVGSCGIGEFKDLPLLGSWCRRIGIELIQVLPLNDTGWNASPYSAVSAFALHPVYVRLDDLPGVDAISREIRTFRQESAERARVDFDGVLSFKLTMLERLFESSAGRDPELDRWIEKNPWIRPYAVYKCLKQQYGQHAWEDWPADRDPTAEGIHERWHDLGDRTLFHAWVQFHLDRQLQEAAGELDSQGIYLKGDIPILMSVDSADVWASRSYFDLSYRAGAPPDMFSTLGQIWGFPVYDWASLERDDFIWWRNRLRRASRYYHAFRIDHVLGFFRIWSIPATENTAVLGRFRPSAPLERTEIEEAIGRRDASSRLIDAWCTKEDAEEHLAEEATDVLERFFDHRADGRYRLRDSVASETAVETLDVSHGVREFLLECHRDRTFLETENDLFVPAWFWQSSRGYLRQDEPVRAGIEELVERYETRSKPVWLDTGRRLLHFVKESGEMLPCAEDLGVIPPGLPDVLEELGILSLKIERWEVDEEGALRDPATFPYLSVSTPAAHDLSTLRQWWEEDDWDREAFAAELGFDDCPPWLTTEVARAIIARSLRSNSAIRVFQIQDLFALTLDLRTLKPEDERINTPGSVSDANWSYVLPIPLGSLPEHEITGTLASLFGGGSDLESPRTGTTY